MCVCPPSPQHGRTCLHLAALYGHFDTVLAILQTGLIDINTANKVHSPVAAPSLLSSISPAPSLPSLPPSFLQSLLLT